jgi:hypothetical protein
MKTINQVIAVITLALLIGFSSCKKTDTTTTAADEITTTVDLSTDQAISDNLTEDANDVFMEAATDNNLTGETPATPLETMGILGCATVTVTPLAGFPKTIVIDFGTGCTSANGITRKGKINVVLSDSLRKPGSTSVMTFQDYYVNRFKKEGTITWTNISTASAKGWQRKVENGKITDSTGKYWLHTALKNVMQTAGYDTRRNLLDDVFSITGTSTVTNSNGVTRSATIILPLEKKTICENITKGSKEIKGPKHTALIDFGNGDCDRIATISIDGGAPKTILLR